MGLKKIKKQFQNQSQNQSQKSISKMNDNVKLQKFLFEIDIDIETIFFFR